MSKYTNQIKVNGNIVRWISSNNIPFADVMAQLVADGTITQQQANASLKLKDHEDAEKLAKYVFFRQTHGYSDEEKAEIQMEFGDEQVVDALTGQIIR